jgi:hypothetical protein
MILAVLLKYNLYFHLILRGFSEKSEKVEKCHPISFFEMMNVSFQKFLLAEKGNSK